MIYLFLAEGFEEIEALSPLDILRRAGVEIKTVGVGSKTVKGAHNICVLTDLTTDGININTASGIILPGGMPGTLNLEADATVIKTLEYCYENNLLVAAICAAPSILGHKGYLQNINATCFPGFEEELTGANIVNQSVVKDGNIITAKGAGTALQFGYEILSFIENETTANNLKNTMCF